MAAKKTKEIAVQDPDLLAELQIKLNEAARLVPFEAVSDLSVLSLACNIRNDEDLQKAIEDVGTLAGFKSKLEKFWDGTKQFHWSRYKLVNAAISDGVPTCNVAGTNRLDEIRDNFELAIKKYTNQRKAAGAQRQAAITQVVASDREDIQKKIESLAMQGDMAGARKLRGELESIQEVIVIPRPVELAGASISEPCKWSLDPDNGMMKLVQAVARGDVALYQDVVIRGVAEKRCIFEIASPVMNARTREMGENLAYPGILVEKDFSLSVGKR